MLPLLGQSVLTADTQTVRRAKPGRCIGSQYPFQWPPCTPSPSTSAEATERIYSFDWNWHSGLSFSFLYVAYNIGDLPNPRPAWSSFDRPPGRLTYRDRNHTSTKPNLPSKNAVPSSERPRAHPTPAGMDSECINIYQKISTWDLFLLSLANHLLSVCFALFLPAFPCTSLRPRHIFSTAHSTSLSALPRSVATLCVLLAGSRPPPQE